MGRLFFTGDIHQSIDIHKLSNSAFKASEDLTKEDILVILGDIGLVWSYGQEAQGEEKYWRNWLSNKPYITFCVIGNHDAYDQIETFPIVSFCGGNAYKITDSIYYGITGEVYDLNGYTCLVVNGADSTDKIYRKEGRDWWREERISEDAVTNALNNLSIYKEVDFVLSHTGGSEVCNSLGLKPTISDLRFDKVLEAAKYKTRYCGHYHKDMWINDKTRILYNDIIEIN